MGDVGYIDEIGRLWFCGRKAHRVACADGTTMFPVPCEALFNMHLDVERSALVAVNQEPVIIVEKVRGTQMSDAGLCQELLEIAQSHELTKRIQRVMFHPSFPVDVRHNAKIDRPKLAQWASQQA
jgi:acyl-coenzyme A synthetase/AMP-(fatty) acid ligase